MFEFYFGRAAPRARRVALAVALHFLRERRTMNIDSNTTVIAQGGFLELREYQNAFREAGLEAHILRPPPEKCSS
jgi:hypothetical protein